MHPSPTPYHGAMRCAALLFVALAPAGCRTESTVTMIAVPPGTDATALRDAQLRERAFQSACVMFVARRVDGGLAPVRHYRTRHSAIGGLLSLDAGMATPLHVSTPLILDRRTLELDGLCLVVRARPDAAWRELPLDSRALREAASSGRLQLPAIESLPELR